METETPPLARGRLDRKSCAPSSIRNTPAYAGKTGPDVRTVLLGEKHPRLRGEDNLRCRYFRALSETPPLTRGRPARVLLQKTAHGNTPAYAGKTAVPRLRQGGREKHPRLRGEDCISLCRAPDGAETPPLTRGRQRPFLRVGRLPGNTPAYAGKTSRSANRCD